MRLSNGAGPEQTARPDLQAVLRHYGHYIEHSGNYECVIHDERQPSMSVDLDKGLVQCFACGFAGSSWDIIMQREDTDFSGARAYGASAGFESEASDGRGEGIPSVLGRKRSGVPRDKGNRRSGRWTRPW